MRLLIACLLLAACTEDAKTQADPVDTAVADAADAAPALDRAVADAAPPVDAAPPEPDMAVVPACAQEDELAPNQGPRQAAVVEPGFNRADLFSCPGATDYFALDLEAGERVRLNLTAQPATIDLDLAVEGPDGMPVAASDGSTGEESLRIVATVAGRYLVRVAGYRDQTGPYRLTVEQGCRTDAACSGDDLCDILTETCAPFLRGACGVDDHEPNDRQETATDLPRAPTQGRVCPEDRDWFAVDLAEGSTLDVSVAFTALRNVDLLVIGPNDRLVDAVLGDANPEHVVLSSVPAGRYRIGVVMPGSGDAEAEYTISTVASSDPCRLDRDCLSLGLPLCKDGVCQPPPDGGRVKPGGACARGSDCSPASEFCFQGDPGGQDNICTRTCATAEECADLGPGAVCIRRQGGMICLNPCQTDDDCSLIRRCDDMGQCNRRGRCTGDNDCGPGEACVQTDFGLSCALVEP